MLKIIDCRQGKCIWCLETTEVVQAEFQDGLSGLLCKKHFWQALKVRCDAKPKHVAEEVRRVPALNAHITRDAENWRLFVPSEEYEATVRRGVSRDGDAAVLSLTPEVTQDLLAAVRGEVSSLDTNVPLVLVVEDASLRPFIRSLLVLEFPHLQIVARREVQGLAALPVPTATITI